MPQSEIGALGNDMSSMFPVCCISYILWEEQFEVDAACSICHGEVESHPSR